MRAAELDVVRETLAKLNDGDGILRRELRDNAAVAVVLSPSRSVFFTARAEMPLQHLGARQQRRRRAAVMSIMRHLRMDGEFGVASLLQSLRQTAVESIGAAGASPAGPVSPLRSKLLLLGQDDDLDRQLAFISGSIAQTLTRGNWAVPLSPKQAALSIYTDLSERGLEVIRQYVGAVRSLFKVRKARA